MRHHERAQGAPKMHEHLLMTPTEDAAADDMPAVTQQQLDARVLVSTALVGVGHEEA